MNARAPKTGSSRGDIQLVDNSQKHGFLVESSFRVLLLFLHISDYSIVLVKVGSNPSLRIFSCLLSPVCPFKSQLLNIIFLYFLNLRKIRF